MLRKIGKIAGIGLIAGTSYLIGETIGHRSGVNYGITIGRLRGMAEIARKLPAGEFTYHLYNRDN